ncbi:MAG: AI-2E family transporter [Rubrivivax sp.]|nr:AI-2E family transporter [Rubrivivax sp.]
MDASNPSADPAPATDAGEAGAVPDAPAGAPAASGRWLRQGLPDLALLVLTLGALALCFLIARPFVTSLAWAMALAVVGWPLHRRIAARLRWPALAAACSLGVIAVLFVVPSVLVVPSIVDEAMGGYRLVRTRIESGAWNDALARHPLLGPVWEGLRQRLDLGDVLQQAGALLTSLGSLAVRLSFIGTVELALTAFFLFYFLRDRDTLLAGLRSLLPLAPAEADRVLGTVHDTVIATVYGKVLVAVVQGLLGGAMFWWLGLPAAWFWAIVMAVLSIIPLLGPPLVWAPAALLLMFEGQWGQAVLLLVWGTAVVGLADNLLYPIVVGRYLRLHTVPLLIALIGGVVVFGAVGFFVGPVVLAVALALLEIWRARAADDRAG